MRPVQTLVHVNFLTFRLFTELNIFKLVANPGANLSILDMHELNGNFVAVCFTICFDQFTEHPFSFSVYDSAAKGHLNVELTVHVSLSEAIASRVKQGEKFFIWEVELLGQTWAIFIVFLEVKRVDVRDEMTVSHESSQKHLQSHQFICLSRV